MPDYPRQPSLTRAAGYRESPNGLLKLSVGFDEETFAELRRRAMAEKVTLGSVIRGLVKKGLRDA